MKTTDFAFPNPNVFTGNETATRLHVSAGRLDLWYHDTNVATWSESTKTLSLCHAGFRTATTKKRMNTFMQALGLPGRVYQSRYDWYVAWQDKTYVFHTHDRLELTLEKE